MKYFPFSKWCQAIMLFTLVSVGQQVSHAQPPDPGPRCVMYVDPNSIIPNDHSSIVNVVPPATTIPVLLAADGTAQGQGASYKAYITGFLYKVVTGADGNTQLVSCGQVGSQETDIPDSQSTPLSFSQSKDLETGTYMLICEIEAYIPIQPTPTNPNPPKQFVNSQTATVNFTVTGEHLDETVHPFPGGGGPRGGP